MPFHGPPEKLADAKATAHPAMSTRKNMDTEASSFEESLAGMLFDLQAAVCRQHAIFSARARSSESTQAMHISNVSPHARPYGGPVYVNNFAHLLADARVDKPVDDDRDLGAPGGGLADGPYSEEGLGSVEKHEYQMAIEISDCQAAEDASKSESSASKSGELRRQSTSASQPKSELDRPRLSRFGEEWRSCRTLGPEHRRVSVKRQLDFIQSSRSSIGVRSLLSFGSSGSSRLDYDRFVRCFMNVAVLGNVVVLGFQAESDWVVWVFVDAVYVLVFAIELAYRLVHSGVAMLTWKDHDWRWNWFDIVLLIMTSVDVAFGLDNLHNRQPSADNAFSHVGSLRVLRITRILRIFRLSHVELFRDLGLMVVGALGGLRTLMCSLVMIAVPVYATALFFTETLGQSKDPDTMSLFSTVRMSMLTSFRCLVLADCSGSDGTPIFVRVLQHHGWGYVTIYCLASVGMSIGLFSVIVAIYVESTMVAAKANQTLQRQRRIEDHYRLSTKMVELVHYIYNEFKLGPADKEFNLEDGLAAGVNRETFRRIIDDGYVRTLLRGCDVPEEDFPQLFDVCDSDGGDILSLDEFVSGIRKLRGVPSRSDIVWIMLRVQELQDRIENLQAKVAAAGHGCTQG